MLGLGLSLTIDVFKRVVKYPKAMVISLLSKMILLTIICFLLVKEFGLPPELAGGLMLLAASPD
jgi:BASS family bile acid:Na+ symporter